MRCPECGEVRWSIIASIEPERECPACGAEMVDERRFPGRTARRLPAERRDQPIAAMTASGSSSGTK